MNHASGLGDRFYRWCEMNRRTLPNETIVAAMNRDKVEGSAAIRAHIPTDASIWRSYCSFLAGKGPGRV